jgi:hypothetical protein
MARNPTHLSGVHRNADSVTEKATCSVAPPTHNIYKAKTALNGVDKMVYLQQSANATTFIIYVITAARQSNVV